MKNIKLRPFNITLTSKINSKVYFVAVFFTVICICLFVDWTMQRRLSTLIKGSIHLQLFLQYSFYIW